MTYVSRRDFLKLAGTFSAGLALNGLREFLPVRPRQEFGKPNILIILFDAMSGPHLSVNGYASPTTPQMERFASHANVYHSHYSGGNFTTPGTASLLTGRLPWSHRAINLGSLVRRDLADNNLFSAIGSGYHRLGFSQNIWADLFLRQFDEHLDERLPFRSFSLKSKTPMLGELFAGDSDIAYMAFDEYLLTTHFVNPVPGSLSLGHLNLLYGRAVDSMVQPQPEMPYGFPFNSFYYFDNQEVFPSVGRTVQRLHKESTPFFAYFHLFSPHMPYCPTSKFVGALPEVKVAYKPHHPLASHVKFQTMVDDSTRYDEYIAAVDDELGRLLNALESDGVFEDTYVILTSDHGEIFERGDSGHATPLLFERIIKIPLLISSPGQTERRDYYAPTSNTDLLPTLAGLAGQAILQGLDGKPLPGLGGADERERSIFSVEAKSSYAFQSLHMVTVSMIQGNMKLVYYKGYEKYNDVFELYDLGDDPEEKKNLWPDSSAVASRMKDELLDALADADRPYQR